MFAAGESGTPAPPPYLLVIDRTLLRACQSWRRDAAILFCGTPDQVYEQLVDFCEYCGGMGNLLMMGHAGPMSHADTVDNLTLFANEVMPRLKEYKQPAGATATAA